MSDNAKTMVLASFAGDSLSLGVHWIYDTRIIRDQFGRVDSFLKPADDSYHPTKNLGEFTHLGDQSFLLLESLAVAKGFDLDDFSNRWRALFKDYRGYIDQATKGTLEGYAAGRAILEAGSESEELAGASRISPLVYCYRNDLEGLVEASRLQAILTHNSQNVVDASEFFGRVCWHVLAGAAPVEAIEKVTADNFNKPPFSDWVEAAIESRDKDSVQAIHEFGQHCGTEAAFPGVIHLVARYENDLEEALIQSAIAGGDNASRGLAIGMILGAHLGATALPDRWVSKLKQKDRILELLDQC